MLRRDGNNPCLKPGLGTRTADFLHAPRAGFSLLPAASSSTHHHITRQIPALDCYALPLPCLPCQLLCLFAIGCPQQKGIKASERRRVRWKHQRKAPTSSLIISDPVQLNSHHIITSIRINTSIGNSPKNEQNRRQLRRTHRADDHFDNSFGHIPVSLSKWQACSVPFHWSCMLAAHLKFHCSHLFISESFPAALHLEGARYGASGSRRDDGTCT